MLEQELICVAPCLDSCDFQPDIDFQAAIASCAGDSMLVEWTVCNIGNFDLPVGTPITFYDGDPTVGAVPIWHTDLIPEKIKRDSCLTFSILMPSMLGGTIFGIANDDGSIPPVFDLASDFPSTGTEECDYTNNMGSFQINFTPPPLDLGPDIETCENGVVVLDAGPGFASYIWSNGEDHQEITVWLPGTYTVVVTDSCGGMQTDDVTITFDPATSLDLGPDTSACEGLPFELAPSGFDDYEWFPKSIFPCDTCASVTVMPEPDSVIEVIAVGTTDLGCISVDTILISSTLPVSGRDTLLFCPGDTVVLFGNPVTEAGEYIGIFPAWEGCDSTHTTLLEPVSNLLLELPPDITIDLGDSIQIKPATNGIDLVWTWSPETWLSCSDCKQPWARPIETIVLHRGGDG